MRLVVRIAVLMFMKTFTTRIDANAAFGVLDMSTRAVAKEQVLTRIFIN
jgi:hypothetical protein